MGVDCEYSRFSVLLSRRQVRFAGETSASQQQKCHTDDLRGNYMRPGQTQTGMSSYRSPYISFHAFTGLKMNSDRSDCMLVANLTQVTFFLV